MIEKNNGFVTTHLFKDLESAEKAYNDAIKRGYTLGDINVIMSEASRDKYYGSILVKEESKTLNGLGIGCATGATVGGIIAAIAAIGTTLVIPGLGVVVAGPLAVGLAGIGAGGVTGSVLGALIGWGIPENKAKIYESGLKDGGIILGITDTKPNVSLETDWKKYTTEVDSKSKSAKAQQYQEA